VKELAIVNAAVRTLDDARPRAAAVAIRDGLVVAVGSDDEVRSAVGGGAEVIDAGGAAVTPGLIDSHIHPFVPQMVRGADLTSCASLAEVQSALAAERDRVGRDGWVLGWGVSYEAFHGNEIDHGLIDDAVGGAPASVRFMDQHTLLVSQTALATAGVTGPVEFSEGAEVVVRDGAPTGELRERAAMELVDAVVPAATEREDYERVVETLRTLNACGITGMHVMDGSPASFDFVRELESAGDLTCRAVVPLWQTPETPFDEMRAQLGLRDEHGCLWRGGVAKFFIDGVIDTGTGWLYEPDTLGDGTEPFWPDPDRYAEAVKLFAQAGFQCVTHATGDRGVRAALDAYLAAGAPGGVRHRIEHIETLTDVDLDRFYREGVVASMQPLHMQWRRADNSDSWALRLGTERAVHAWRTADLLRSGARLPLGSDWPVAQNDPRLGMAWARLRRRPGDLDGRVFEPDQRLSGLDTLHGYTTAAAATVGERHLGGRIMEGLRGDLTVFAEDPVDISADDLPHLPVLATVVDGRVVHRDGV
jgi:predicted amidohydrolase YtcJ